MKLTTFFFATLLAGGTSLRSAPILESDACRVTFNASSGCISRIENKLAGEGWEIHGDEFSLVTNILVLSPQTVKLVSLDQKGDSVEATYAGNGRRVVSTYRLGATGHFLEKHLTIQSAKAFDWKEAVVSQIAIPAGGVEWVRYPHQKTVTFFGRTPRGGLFLGLEKPFDTSKTEGSAVTLGYAPSLTVKANEIIQTEPVYIGVYKRGDRDVVVPNLPLQSESDAMVKMTSSILGPPRHGFVPMACGWWCEMEHHTYTDEASVEADLRSLDFLVDVGIDWLSDNHPWSGETDKMNALTERDHYRPGPFPQKKYEYARKKGIKTLFWGTMNNTHPWWLDKGKGQPFLMHKPEWLVFPQWKDYTYTLYTGTVFPIRAWGNCIANEPFAQWINSLNQDGLRTDYFSGWAMDGDFVGGQGMAVPVDCPSAMHDHLAGDSTYACERALTRMTRQVREKYPASFILMCRPAMDLGVFSLEAADAAFTIDETGKPTALPGMAGQPVNVIYGDTIRKMSRVRVHHHFFPHYIDQPQVFVATRNAYWPQGLDWPSDKIDYVMLSALSCSPNQIYYLPTKAGIPKADKQTIRQWLDWGRANVDFLQVRTDLPDWPSAGKVDGSAHVIGRRGLLFLFNPNAAPAKAKFVLSTEAIGLSKGERFNVTQSYPAAEISRPAKWEESVEWEVAGQSAYVLKIEPSDIGAK